MSTRARIGGRARGPRVYHVRADHPLAAAVLAELAIEYSARYGDTAGSIHRRMRERPPAEFTAPHGDLLVLVEHGEPVAGGGFRRVDGTTAEMKRVWTERAQRRRGLATRVLAELESEMIRLGYRQVLAATGDQQPEARGLYTAAGYTEAGAATAGRRGPRFRFEKALHIPEHAGLVRAATVLRPGLRRSR
ncbi:GNAT family N-acetyltransferase [Nocardia sp. NPDC024068]|uniref:GNAT family N-acetyltransferase n=1 Tax=Nocardia sp. NPDC024068 TaxID=3157197 RepID=UPI0033C56CFD